MWQWGGRSFGRQKAYVNWTADSILKAACLDNEFMSITKPNQLMLFRETLVVYWENRANTQMTCVGKIRIF
jgi:hypothetical protein